MFLIQMKEELLAGKKEVTTDTEPIVILVNAFAEALCDAYGDTKSPVVTLILAHYIVKMLNLSSEAKMLITTARRL